MNGEARELLARYSHALGLQTYRDDLLHCSTRFRTNHQAAIDNALDAAMVRVFEAHVARVDGAGSPALCDRALAEAVG